MAFIFSADSTWFSADSTWFSADSTWKLNYNSNIICRMFLCNFLGCGGAGRLNEMSERNLLNAINESDRVVISLKENAPYIPSSAHHSKKASLNK